METSNALNIAVGCVMASLLDTDMKEEIIGSLRKVEDLEVIVRKQSEVIKQLHKHVFLNENIKAEEREFILANLDTVIRLY